jgi:hypothetical protein
MKKVMKLTMFLAVALLASSFREQGKWLIDPQSRLIIHGSTNVNSFTCMFENYEASDTLEYVSDSNTIQLKVLRNKMSIPIRNFDCGSKQITKDFWETLKAQEHPQLQIYFRSFRNGTMSDKSTVDGVVDITLAGATRRYVVHYHTRVPEEGTILLSGTQAVNFSDFNLRAPQKMMGLIQVQECLEVEFNLTLKSL